MALQIEDEVLFKDHEVLQTREWDSYESDVYPLILNRSPATYIHQASTFIVKKTHEQYSQLCGIIDLWYLDAVGKGTNVSINCTSKLDMDDLVPKKWYIIDFREQPDTSFTNCITLKNFDKLSAHAQARLAFEIYEKVKGLVIFADHIKQVPLTLMSLSVWGLTEGYSKELTNFLRNGCTETPKNYAVLKTTNELSGYTRFENMPTFVQLHK